MIMRNIQLAQKVKNNCKKTLRKSECLFFIIGGDKNSKFQFNT